MLLLLLLITVVTTTAAHSDAARLGGAVLVRAAIPAVAVPSLSKRGLRADAWRSGGLAALLLLWN